MPSFIDWETLDKKLYISETIETALNYRFCGMRNLELLADNRSSLERRWESIVDIATVVVGMNDSFYVRPKEECLRVQKDIKNNQIPPLPHEEQWVCSLAAETVNAEQMKHLHECVQAGRTLREEAKLAIGHFSVEISLPREISSELYTLYADSVRNHREAFIACGHPLMPVSRSPTRSNRIGE